MIERAERYVSAQEVRPGDRVVVDGHHIDVETVSLRTEEVVLTGVPVGRTSGSKRKTHVTVAHKTSVTVLAPGYVLDEIEDTFVAAAMGEAVTMAEGVLSVHVESTESTEWTVPLREALVKQATVHHIPNADTEETG